MAVRDPGVGFTTLDGGKRIVFVSLKGGTNRFSLSLQLNDGPQKWQRNPATE
jgi:hypothetical protein